MSGTLADIGKLRDEVKGNPGAIDKIAGRWRATATSCATNVETATSAAARVNRAWDGSSAEAFTRYMRRVGAYEDDFVSALNACASALEGVAGELRAAHTNISRIYTNAQTWLKDNAALPESERNSVIAKRYGEAKAIRDDANEAVSNAATKINNKLRGISAEKAKTFSELLDTGTGAFDGGSGWDPVKLSDRDKTLLQSAGNGGIQPTSYNSPTGSGGTSGDGSFVPAGAPVRGGGGAPAPKGKVVEWIKQALAILKAKGYDVDPNNPQDVERLWTLIWHESGGNPNATNNWDINAKNGVPSQGLMQTIPPTFNAHKLPGHGDILNPVDNIIAGTRYIFDRYGSLEAVVEPRRGGWYGY